MALSPNLQEAVEAIKTSVKGGYDDLKGGYDDLAERIEVIEAGRDRPKAATRDVPSTDVWVDRKSGERVHVLEHKQRVADLEPNKTGVSLGRWLRGVVLGDKADDSKELADERKALATTPDASGGYTVPKPLALDFIDLLRANMVLSQAGARTVPMARKTLGMARVTGDPTVTWHIQNASIAETVPTLGAVVLNAHTAVSVVKFSLEIAQDSINIEELLTRTLSGALATAIDAAGLAGTGTVTSPVGNSPTGVAAFANRNTVTSIGVPSNWDFVANGIRELLVDNVPLERIGGLVMSPLLWSKMSKLKTGISSDQTALPMPPHMQGRPLFVTTAAADTGSPVRTTAYIADWTDLLFGVRQEVSVRILNEAYFASNLQFAMVAYARVDFQPVRPASFCTLEGVTVGAG